MLFPYITLSALVIGLFTINSAALLRIFTLIQIGIAYFYGLMTPNGVLFILMFWGLCEWHWRYPTKGPWLNFCRILIVLMITLLFANHQIPGFHNLKVFDAIHVSPASSPYTMYLNFDKTIVAVILLITSGLLLKRTKPFGLDAWVKTLSMSCLCILILMPLAIFSGFIQFDPKFPEVFWLWALNNLLLVCVAEEVIFRGIIQNYLMQIAQRRNWPSFIPILITAILFGLVLLGHVQGGIALVIFVMIAGLFYGYVYYLTQRLEAAILAHFGVNACHFLLFTYPSVVSYYSY